MKMFNFNLIPRTELHIHYLTGNDPMFTAENIIKNRKYILENLEKVTLGYGGSFAKTCFIHCYYPEGTECTPLAEIFLKNNLINDHDHVNRWGVCDIAIPSGINPKTVVCYNLSNLLKKYLIKEKVRIEKYNTMGMSDIRILNPQVIRVFNLEHTLRLDEVHVVISADETVFFDTRGLHHFKLENQKFYINSITELSEKVTEKLTARHYLTTSSRGTFILYRGLLL